MSRRNLSVPLWDIPIGEFISLTDHELQELHSWYRWSLEEITGESHPMLGDNIDQRTIADPGAAEWMAYLARPPK